MNAKSVLFAALLSVTAMASAWSASPTTNTKSYTQSKAQVFDAVVSTFQQLKIPVSSQVPETGTVTGSVISGAIIVKETMVNAKVTTIGSGTEVVYSRSKRSGLNTTTREDDDPDATREFFDALDAQLKRRAG